MANLDANALVSVKENFAELAEKMNSPDQCKFWCGFYYTTKIQHYDKKKEKIKVSNPA